MHTEKYIHMHSGWNSPKKSHFGKLWANWTIFLNTKKICKYSSLRSKKWDFLVSFSNNVIFLVRETSKGQCTHEILQFFLQALYLQLLLFDHKAQLLNRPAVYRKLASIREEVGHSIHAPVA